MSVDVLAVGAIRRAQELGIRVPEEVSIVGFDDIELAQIAYPALTTVHVPHRVMGRRAAQVLVGLLRGEPISESEELQVSLTFRDSLSALAE